MRGIGIACFVISLVYALVAQCCIGPSVWRGHHGSSAPATMPAPSIPQGIVYNSTYSQPSQVPPAQYPQPDAFQFPYGQSAVHAPVYAQAVPADQAFETQNKLSPKLSSV
eukprot:TRINITY_DN3236_c0_g1_i1.p2 TRINITY_DN3236_c0_g1~~TRINITY_DN3236_c0_g1_i1.p2  ORF type:complete len:110 (-),score=3.38 TRINITY_DN3236_c0_g1_i1:271-600(-)